MSETNGEAISPAGADPPQRRWRVRVWQVLVAVAVILVAVVLALRWHWKRGFRERIEAIAAAGYPVTLEELDAWYESPKSGENAADWVQAAASYLNKPSDKEYKALWRIVGSGGNRLSRREPIDEDTKVLLVAHVRDNAKALELLGRGAGIEESRYPVGYNDGSRGAFLPHLTEVQEGCLLLCLKAVLCGETGDGGGATRALESAFGVAGTLGCEPMYASQVVGNWSKVRAVAALARVLCATELTVEQLERLGTVLDEAYDPDGMVRGLAGMQCLCLEVFESPESVDPDLLRDLPAPALMDAYCALGLAAREGILFLAMMRAYIEASRLPMSERGEAFKAIGERARAHQKRCLLLAKLWGGDGLRPFDVTCLAHLRTAAAGLAVERYRLATGHWPESLAGLVPAFLERVPEDPFTGAPLRYKRLDQGFVVYSVGEDGVDGGGKERPSRQAEEPGETYDITFVVLR